MLIHFKMLHIQKILIPFPPHFLTYWIFRHFWVFSFFKLYKKFICLIFTKFGWNDLEINQHQSYQKDFLISNLFACNTQTNFKAKLPNRMWVSKMVKWINMKLKYIRIVVFTKDFPVFFFFYQLIQQMLNKYIFIIYSVNYIMLSKHLSF